MDELLDKFNNLVVNNNVEEGDVKEIDSLVDDFKTKLSDISSNKYQDEWSKFFKNYKKINNLSSILRAFKSSPGWKKPLERSFTKFLSILDKMNQYYLDNINFSVVDDVYGDDGLPKLGNYWDLQSTMDTLGSIKNLLTNSIAENDIETKIKDIVDAYTLIVLLFKPVFNINEDEIRLSSKRVKHKLPKPLGVHHSSGVKKPPR